MLAYFEQHRSQASEGLVLLPGVQEVLLALKARPQGSSDIWQGGAEAYLGRSAIPGDRFKAALGAHQWRHRHSFCQAEELLWGVRTIHQSQARGDVAVGLVTGNLEPIAWGKMRALGLLEAFSEPHFGGFGSDYCSGAQLRFNAAALPYTALTSSAVAAAVQSSMPVPVGQDAKGVQVLWASLAWVVTPCAPGLRRNRPARDLARSSRAREDRGTKGEREPHRHQRALPHRCACLGWPELSSLAFDIHAELLKLSVHQRAAFSWPAQQAAAVKESAAAYDDMQGHGSLLSASSWRSARAQAKRP